MSLPIRTSLDPIPPVYTRSFFGSDPNGITFESDPVWVRIASRSEWVRIHRVSCKRKAYPIQFGYGSIWIPISSKRGLKLNRSKWFGVSRDLAEIIPVRSRLFFLTTSSSMGTFCTTKSRFPTCRIDFALYQIKLHLFCFIGNKL